MSPVIAGEDTAASGEWRAGPRDAGRGREHPKDNDQEWKGERMEIHTSSCEPQTIQTPSSRLPGQSFRTVYAEGVVEQVCTAIGERERRAMSDRRKRTWWLIISRHEPSGSCGCASYVRHT